jgi:hypothetical protein
VIDNVQMYYQHHGETCVATLEVHTSSGTILKTIDLSGNTVPSSLIGAISIVNAIRESLGLNPQESCKVVNRERNNAKKTTD